MKLDFSEIEPRPLAQAKAPAPSAPRLSFDLPRALLLQLVLTAAAYLAVMSFAFRAGHGIGIIFAVFGMVLIAYYGLPVLMQRQASGDPQPPRRGAWGIDTASGYLSGRAAYAQVMTVPLLMLAWAVIVAIIH